MAALTPRTPDENGRLGGFVTLPMHGHSLCLSEDGKVWHQVHLAAGTCTCPQYQKSHSCPHTQAVFPGAQRPVHHAKPIDVHSASQRPAAGPTMRLSANPEPRGTGIVHKLFYWALLSWIAALQVLAQCIFRDDIEEVPGLRTDQTKRFIFRMDEAMYKKLMHLAQRHNRSIAAEARTALDVWIKDHVDDLSETVDVA